MALIRKISLVLPFLAAACATPGLSDGSADEQRWFDARIEEGHEANAAPPGIPDKTPALTPQEIEQAAENVLDAREDLLEAERASRDGESDTESYARDARERATPPDPID
jgi:hypothetical protein